MQSKGSYRNTYHHARLHNPTVKFSLQCRINAISHGIIELSPAGIDKILDLGSADGLLAMGITERVPGIKQAYVLDIEEELLKVNPFPSVQGDCCQLPFIENSFNVVTAAALIEHLPNPQAFLRECYRVLKPDGALLLTTPTPFFEWLATQAGYLKDSGHFARYTLTDIQRLSESEGFEVVYTRKFMISPIDFPAHLKFESILRKMGFSFLMLNQIVGSIKK